MKLVRFGEKGMEKPGIMNAQEQILDASSIVQDWDALSLDNDSLAKVERALDSLPIVDSEPRLAAPVNHVGKLIGCALTYGKHAAEAGLELPQEPMFLITAPSAINGPYDQVMMPRDGSKLDWEVELGVVMGKRGSYISVENALDHVAGFCVANDVSERVFQLERGTQWAKGKSHDTFKPLGPWLLTKDEVANPNALDISLKVNGQVMQSSNTSDMVFSVAELISNISEYLTWEPGDVMITGTPAGVAYGMDPPLYLQVGDVMEAEIELLGSQRSTVAEYKI